MTCGLQTPQANDPRKPIVLGPCGPSSARSFPDADCRLTPDGAAPAASGVGYYSVLWVSRSR